MAHVRFARVVLCAGALAAAAALALPACSQDGAAQSAYQEQFDELPFGGKADLLSDLAEPIALGQTRSGTVEPKGQQGDRRVYVMELRVGDRVLVEMRTKRNSLKPDFIMYYGSSTRVSSERYELDGADLGVGVKALRKEYVARDPGRYALLVRAYQGQGSGGYELSATCQGGPCNGQFPDPAALDAGQAAECIWQARACAFGKLAQEPAPVSAQRAKALFDGCLGSVSLDEGYGCQSACAYQTSSSYGADAAAELCTAIIGSLSFYAGQPAACFDELDGCLRTCFDLGGNYGHDDFLATKPYVCLEGGFNSNCDAYARAHVACGGTDYQADTWRACCSLVSATDGAWTDDMDTLCADSCDDEYCDQVLSDCNAACPSGGSCYDDCIADRGWSCD